MNEEMAEGAEVQPVKTKKGGFIKLLLIGVGVVALGGGGAAAGMYFTGMPIPGMASKEAQAASNEPQLVPKSEQKRAGGEKGEGSGQTTPAGEGGEKHASNYYALEKEFTSNLFDSVHFIQVGVAISTPYDDRVIENLKTHEIAVRSAVLMALGETEEEQVFTSEGKRILQRRVAKAINDTLKEKEGFGGIGNVYFTNFIVQ